MRVVLEDVTRAALNLQSNGKSVTTRSVREELGRGSYSTIGRFLAELGLRALEEHLDSSLSERIRLQALALARTIWRAAESAHAEKAKAAEGQWQMRLCVISAQLKKEREEHCAADRRVALLEEGRQAWRLERAAMRQEAARLRNQLRRSNREATKRR